MHNQKLIADYLRKCFVSVDGLWFMKVEQGSDFEKALELDIEVWKVLPKIEARTIQELLCLGNGMDALRQALEFKLSAEDSRFELSPLGQDGFTLEVRDCSWVAYIKKANREQFLERISESICSLEFGNFALEFGSDISVEHDRSSCRSKGGCRFHFQESGRLS
jgi:hypothetical protein